MKYILIGLGIGLITLVYSACIISGKCSRVEDMEEIKSSQSKV